MNLPRQKAFVYLRRSQDRKDRQVLSIEGQRKEMKRLLKLHDLTPIWMEAESQSAYKTGRPVFDNMIHRIESGEARVILTWTANRLARNARDAGTLIHMLQEGQLLKIVVDGKTYSAANADDQFMLNIDFGMSKKSSDDTSRNVKRGNLAKYERGEYPGNAPIGYKNIKVGHFKNIGPEKERAPLVIASFKAAASGQYTLDELHKHTRDEIGLTTRTGRPIGKSTLNDLLQRKLYTGNFMHGGELRVGTYDPLISLDLFEQAQVAMGWAKNSKKVRSSTSGRDFLFKGPLRCCLLYTSPSPRD